ncbi:RecQ family ATP-dependent DNA helicase [Aurantibacillus circumpalustris]|uniref:RecQ family ATP-dependent DNA helicase n=1 Tax=Aurantibacillus circumpalustris TaxID=3036359 RepID=UPI00295BABFD|nr:ATP-dependent DNA helicase RecQ [Aurantibacillus circumpalustris]
MNANIKEDIHRLLKKYWGFDSFRPLQEDIILSVLDKHDTLALLPTGGGKSLCFQVPGLALGGTTLVISPLIALMNDQVQNLKKKGISAVAISAAMNFKEIDVALNNAALGHVQFIYVSPERLQNETFVQKISYLPITLIAVDEAHCISQWGFDFRPSYRKIATLRPYFPDCKIIALTASATKDVVEDIQKQLDFKDANVFRQSFVRKNLRYVVQLEENKIERLFKLIHNIGGSGLVYVRNRKKTEELAAFLKKNKISSMAYHAGLKYEQRQSVQQQWIDNNVQVICATNAFGMGIDKPDVRFVVHLDLPESLEAYFQEAGRGGRDGKIAYSTIFYTKADQQRLIDNFQYAFPELDYVKNTYQAICNYYQIAISAGQGTNVQFDIDKICKSYNLSPILVYNSIKFLEKENYLSLIDGGFEPSKVLFTANKEDIYQFELLYPKFEPLVKTLLRSYGGLFENYVYINEKDLAYRVKISAASIMEYLAYLDKQEILSYVPQSALPKLVFMQDRVHANYLEFNPENYHRLKEQYLERINSVIEYTNNDKLCRQVQLLMYFNEFNYSDCGHCDVCISKRPKDYETVKTKLLTSLKNKSLTLEQLKDKMKSSNDETWIKAFNELIDDNIIVEEESIFYLKKDSKERL